MQYSCHTCNIVNSDPSSVLIGFGRKSPGCRKSSETQQFPISMESFRDNPPTAKQELIRTSPLASPWNLLGGVRSGILKKNPPPSSKPHPPPLQLIRHDFDKFQSQDLFFREPTFKIKKNTTHQSTFRNSTKKGLGIFEGGYFGILPTVTSFRHLHPTFHADLEKTQHTRVHSRILHKKDLEFFRGGTLEKFQAPTPYIPCRPEKTQHTRVHSRILRKKVFWKISTTQHITVYSRILHKEQGTSFGFQGVTPQNDTDSGINS